VWSSPASSWIETYSPKRKIWVQIRPDNGQKNGSSRIGLISIGDLLKFIISKKEFAIDQLEHYIQGGIAA